MKRLNTYIDHTLLKPEATLDQIVRLCQEAKQYQFACVCVNPIWVKHASQELINTNVKVCNVVGFPLGAHTTLIKVAEAVEAISNGADEIDMVLNIGALKSQHYDQVKEDVQAVVEAVKPKIVKVILETGLLTEDEKVIACRLCVEAGAHFVKTSTGFGSSGAHLDDIKLMRQIVGPHIGIKASGGIRDKETALAMIEAGANRIGTSSGVAIIQAICCRHHASKVCQMDE